MPATVDALKIHLGIDPASTVDAAAMEAAVDAANDWVSLVRPDLTTDAAGVLAVWPIRVDRAAVLESAREYGRRGSVQGVAAFADLGVTYLPGSDPDVQRLLELGKYQPPVIA